MELTLRLCSCDLCFLWEKIDDRLLTAVSLICINNNSHVTVVFTFQCHTPAMKHKKPGHIFSNERHRSRDQIIDIDFFRFLGVICYTCICGRRVTTGCLLQYHLRIWMSNTSHVTTHRQTQHRDFQIECKLTNMVVFFKLTNLYLWNTIPPEVTKSKKSTFSKKVTVKATMSLTLVSFEKASSVEFTCQIWCLYLLLYKNNMPLIELPHSIRGTNKIWSLQSIQFLDLVSTKYLIFGFGLYKVFNFWNRYTYSVVWYIQHSKWVCLVGHQSRYQVFHPLILQTIGRQLQHMKGHSRLQGLTQWR